MNSVARLAVLLFIALPAAAGATPDAERACLRNGSGFVLVPGTATCIRIGGRVRAEGAAGMRRGADRGGATTLQSGGTVSLDARTETAYGPVRAFVRMRAGEPSH